MTAFGGELGEAKERLIYYKWTHTHTEFSYSTKQSVRRTGDSKEEEITLR